MAQKQMLMVMKRLLPVLLAVVVVLSLSFVHVGLGADREGVGFKITLGSGKHPVSSEFYSLDRHGRSALSDINPIRCTEPRRVWRRLQLLRKWSHYEQDKEQVFF